MRFCILFPDQATLVTRLSKSDIFDPFVFKNYNFQKIPQFYPLLHACFQTGTDFTSCPEKEELSAILDPFQESISRHISFIAKAMSGGEDQFPFCQYGYGISSALTLPGPGIIAFFLPFRCVFKTEPIYSNM